MDKILKAADDIAAVFNVTQEWLEPGRSAVVKILKQLVEENFTSTNKPSDEIADYDCGMLNDHGGGNVGWWFDYIRYEIGRCNDYWRSATSHVG
jgi:hypothetical protein